MGTANRTTVQLVGMRTAWLILATATMAFMAATSPATGIRHDAACRPAGFTFTDSPDSWLYADALAGFSCTGEMHPTAGGPNPDNHDFSYANVPAGITKISVTICPIFVFVAGWNPNLNIYFLPGGASLPATNPATGQQFQAMPQVPTLLGMVPLPLNIGSSANAAGCDSVTNAGPPAGPAAGGRFYIDVVRAGGGGGYSFSASLA